METREEYKKLAAELVENFYKKQNAGVLSNISKRNYGDLSITRDKVVSNLREQMSGYADENGNDLNP